MAVIVHSNNGVTLLGGGEIAPGTVQDALRRAPTLVAADGGANRAVELGLRPTAVIGDFDSLDPVTAARLSGSTLHRIPDQDSTDFDKCLRAIRAPLVLALGFTGARLDHTLASFSTLARFAQQRCVLVGGGDLCFLAPSRLVLELYAGMRVSLFPMAPVTGRSQGLRWPIEGLTFTPAGVIGTSNEASAACVVLDFDGPGMLVLLPEAALDAALAALADAPGWPTHG